DAAERLHGGGPDDHEAETAYRPGAQVRHVARRGPAVHRVDGVGAHRRDAEAVAQPDAALNRGLDPQALDAAPAVPASWGPGPRSTSSGSCEAEIGGVIVVVVPKARSWDGEGERLGPAAGAAGGRVRPAAGGPQVQARITLPERPARMTSKACWYSSIGKRWVITGVTSRPAWSRATILYQVSNICRP